ncbi:hypothetical protein Salmuc_01721 [Salipiger mucosus DSM 16094]|uniref:Uncharacterized protein n=2 Tax=Salipiger mucosus TaxID=263378 RepID=S9QRB4_9RHOB|nr:hypothetical protein Salmuc_01721 [Salipiger mucosus DSM 16094]
MHLKSLCYVPRNEDGEFVEISLKAVEDALDFPVSNFPDIHSTREKHAVQRLARIFHADLDVHWGRYRHDPRLNGDTFILKNGDRFFDANRVAFTDELNAGCLFNKWDLEALSMEGRGGMLPGLARMRPELMRRTREEVSGPEIVQMAAEAIQGCHEVLHTRLTAEFALREGGSHFDAVVSVEEMGFQGRGASVWKVESYRGVELLDFEHVREFIERDYPGALLQDEVSTDPGLPAPK